MSKTLRQELDELTERFNALTHEDIEANYAPGGQWYGFGCKWCAVRTSFRGWYRTVPVEASDIYCHTCANRLKVKLGCKIVRYPNQQHGIYTGTEDAE